MPTTTAKTAAALAGASQEVGGSSQEKVAAKQKQVKGTEIQTKSSFEDSDDDECRDHGERSGSDDRDNNINHTRDTDDMKTGKKQGEQHQQQQNSVVSTCHDMSYNEVLEQVYHDMSYDIMSQILQNATLDEHSISNKTIIRRCHILDVGCGKGIVLWEGLINAFEKVIIDMKHKSDNERDGDDTVGHHHHDLFESNLSNSNKTVIYELTITGIDMSSVMVYNAKCHANDILQKRNRLYSRYYGCNHQNLSVIVKPIIQVIQCDDVIEYLKSLNDPHYPTYHHDMISHSDIVDRDIIFHGVIMNECVDGNTYYSPRSVIYALPPPPKSIINRRIHHAMHSYMCDSSGGGDKDRSNNNSHDNSDISSNNDVVICVSHPLGSKYIEQQHKEHPITTPSHALPTSRDEIISMFTREGIGGYYSYCHQSSFHRQFKIISLKTRNPYYLLTLAKKG